MSLAIKGKPGFNQYVDLSRTRRSLLPHGRDLKMFLNYRKKIPGGQYFIKTKLQIRAFSAF